jgi:phosphatidylinositol-3-phosphatase
MCAAHPRSADPRRRRHYVGLVAALLATVTTVGVGGAAAQASAPTSKTTVRHTTVRHTTAPRAATYSHIIVVVMENLSYNQATGTPGYQTLAHRWAAATDAYATSHPSLPNYLDLTSGSTFGIQSDCTSCYVSSNNIGAQFSARHLTWGDYSEGVPRRCYLGANDGLYAGKHNPFRYYDDIRASYSMCNHLAPLSTFTSDLRRAGKLPRFSFVTPNLCHDGHDCSPSEAFSWLQGFVGSVTASSAWKHNGLLIVTWDEGSDSDTSQVLPSGKVLSGGGGGHMATFFIAPHVPRGAVITQPVSHEMLLASIEANFGLALLNGAAAWSSHTLALP